MQQLTLEALALAYRHQGDIVEIRLPLPHTPASTLRWVSQFARLTGATIQSEEWGADRFQSTLFTGDMQILINIEWLCDAIWLELIGGGEESGAKLWNWCQRTTQPKAEIGK